VLSFDGHMGLVYEMFQFFLLKPVKFLIPPVLVEISFYIRKWYI